MSQDFFNFSLPDVTKEAGGYIADDNDPADAIERVETGEQITTSTEPAKPWDAYEKERGTPDDHGTPFDPREHHCPPTKTVSGKWRKKSAKQKREWGFTKEGAPPEGTTSNAEFRKAAQNMAYLYANAHRAAFPDAEPDDKELLPLVNAWERKMLQDGLTELPPNVDLILNSGLYTVGVAQREKNQSVVDKIKGQFSNAYNWVLLNAFGIEPKKKLDPKKPVQATHAPRAVDHENPPESAADKFNREYM